MPADARRFDDLFCEYGPIQVRRFFGGEAIWDGSVMIALVRQDDMLYFTTSDATRPTFVAEGCKPFSFMRAGKLVETSWLSIPDRLYDDPLELAQWARNSRDTALQKAVKKKPGKKRKRA